MTTLPSEMRIRRNNGYDGLMQLKGDFKYKVNCAEEGYFCVYTGSETNGKLVWRFEKPLVGASPKVWVSRA